ncbi:MAG: hypothetical protein AAB706_00065 [Patescibacteria group bacterium]
MFEKLDIKKFFKKVSKKKTFHYVHGQFHPRHDWSILIVIFFIIISFGFIFNFYLFLRIAAGDIFRTETEAVKVETLDREAIQGMVNLFKERARLLEELKSNPIEIPDPLL